MIPPFKEYEIFKTRAERSAFRKFKREGGRGLNEEQQTVLYLRYYNANSKNRYFRKGSGREAIAQRTGIPEYRVQIIISRIRQPDGYIPVVKSKHDI